MKSKGVSCKRKTLVVSLQQPGSCVGSFWRLIGSSPAVVSSLHRNIENIQSGKQDFILLHKQFGIVQNVKVSTLHKAVLWTLLLVLLLSSQLLLFPISKKLNPVVLKVLNILIQLCYSKEKKSLVSWVARQLPKCLHGIWCQETRIFQQHVLAQTGSYGKSCPKYYKCAALNFLRQSKE